MKDCKFIVVSAVCLMFLQAAGLAADRPWAGYRFAPDAVQEIDLASDTDWTLTIDGGPQRPIKVTAGGWNSDQQAPQIDTMNGVRDHVIYAREIQIPADAVGRVVKVLFGACNYGAEVFVDDRKVGEHCGAMTPFEVDVTAAVKPGDRHTLKVKAYHRRHYHPDPARSPCTLPVGFDFPAGSRSWYSWAGNTKYAYGLTGYVRLAIYPAVSMSDLFVRPSVTGKSLAYDVWISNGSSQQCDVVLKGALSAWDKRTWSYPSLPDQRIVLPPGQTRKVTVENVPWNLGSESFWWPNIPFREDYKATLHWLKLALELNGKIVHQRQQRFGFVEYKEGPFYYTVNGVRFTSFGDSNSYGQIGEYDCWTETPCFQLPRGEFKGCPETWKRYQRIGFNSMRLSTSVPTPYMLETADEAGYMLVPEGGSWGNGTSKFDKTNFCVQVQETIRACRNHPCVARYSLANESISGDAGDWRWLIDAALEVDSTRPYVFEVLKGRGTGLIKGMNAGHAYRMQHYDPIEKGGDHIRGMGECAWSTDGLADFTMQVVHMRHNDYAHMAPWSWLNYWPNFLEGMNADRHPWKANDYGDRKDGVDGWGSPIIDAVQRALDPFLIVDIGLLEMNPKIKENSKSGKIGWPYQFPTYVEGSKIERKIEVFNGALTGTNLQVRWTARWDSADGPEAARGVVGPINIDPGFHATETVIFHAPAPGRDVRILYLVMETMRHDIAVYTEDRVRFTVKAK